MSVGVKLCGVRTAKDAMICAAAGADEVGVIFAPSSKRKVTIATAQMVRDALPSTRMVGVFLDATSDELAGVLRDVKLDAIQLHGAIPQGRPALPIYVALHVDGAAALSKIDELKWAARILLDSPRGGGSGARFDWSLAQRARDHHPRELFVAGGLTPDNVAEAIAAARPDGVDVASGIEDAQGFKDPDKVRAFVRAAKEAT